MSLRYLGNSNLVSAAAQTAVGITAGSVLAANSGRKGFMIQNTGTTTIKLSFGATNPTQTVYHVALRSAGVADDGTGATYTDDLWTDAVRAISSVAGGTIVITEFI